MVALLNGGSGPGRRRRPQEAAGFRDGDVEPATAVEAGPPGPDPAPPPVADGALRCADECAELLEGEEAVVVPLGGDLDGLHGLHGASPSLCSKSPESASVPGLTNRRPPGS